MTTNDKASIEDQKKVMAVLKSLERPADMEEVRELDLVLGAHYVKVSYPEECIKELLGAGIIYRAEGPSGDVLKRTEAENE